MRGIIGLCRRRSICILLSMSYQMEGTEKADEEEEEEEEEEGGGV